MPVWQWRGRASEIGLSEEGNRFVFTFLLMSGEDSEGTRRARKGDDECIDQEKGKLQEVEYGLI